jgi:Na+-transporting methylmalonyl-CoA/oxaloacetate decarboxylase gamma subunit
MFHKSIEYVDKLNLTPEEKAINSLNLFKEFFPGVGKYFLKMVIGFVIYFSFMFILLVVIQMIGDKFIGFPSSVTYDELLKAASNSEKAMALLNKVTPADKIKIMQWDLLGLIVMGIFSYLTMFWTQAIISEGKRPFRAFWESIKTVFKNPFTTIIIYLSQCAGIIGVSFISAAYSLNVIIQFIGLMVLILVVVYFTMMSFLYFEKYR